MKPMYDPERVKQNVKTAVQNGAIWQDGDGNIVTSVFELTMALQSCGVNCQLAVQTPAVNNISVIDPVGLQTLFGKDALPDIKQRSGAARLL